MIEINIPKDIREFEPTLVGVLTTRQVICAIVICITVYATYSLEKAAGIDPMSAPLFILPAVPPGLIGWFKPYGMHFEKFFMKAFRDNVLCPTKRLYKVHNFYDIIAEEQKYKDMSPEEIKAAKKEEYKRKQQFKKAKEPPRSRLPQELRSYK